MINSLGIVVPIKVMKLEYRIKADGTMKIVDIDSDITFKGKISACKGNSIVDIPCRIKADFIMLIVVIDLDTIFKGKSSTCNGNRSVYKGKSFSSTCKGKIIVYMPCSLVGCHQYFVYESIFD